MKLALQFIIFLLFAPYFVWAQQPLSPVVLTQPILDGRCAAGICVGDTEVKVGEKMGGLPTWTQVLNASNKTLTYANVVEEEKVNLYVHVFMEHNLVVGLEIMSVPLVGIGHVYKGKTQKGFQFGDSVEKTKDLYGADSKTSEGSDGAILWYKKEGIIFVHYHRVEEGVEKWPTSLVILKPNVGIPYHLKERGGPFAKWD